jgi:hypothetical protein
MGALFQLLREPKDVVIEHNTGFADDAAIVLAVAEPLANFVFRDNIVNYGLHGIFGDGKGSGLAAINVFIGNTGAQSLYPAENTFVGTMVDVGFVDVATGSYELHASSPCGGGASDGTDIGVDFALMAAGNARLGVSIDAPAIGLATVAWSGIATATSTDWMGLYVPGTVNGSLVAWVYVSCSLIPDASRGSGSCVFEQPGGLPLGTYELRLFANNDFTRLATSTIFVLTGAR